jgi:exonuclease SbcC
MRPTYLRAKGFIGFKRGMGTDELTLDLSGLSGLIALAGQNGSGKSSCIELLHPYPMLASRDGALFHHTFLRNSEKELHFTYEGDAYKTLVKIDCESERSEGFIWKNGNPEVKGKIREYGAYIKKLLGSPALFFSSVFCPQNARKLTDMQTAEIKGLFAEFLRLDRLTAYEQTAKACITAISGKTGAADRRIAALRDRLAKREALEAEAGQVAEILTALSIDRDRLATELTAARERLEGARKVAAENEAQKKRREDLRNVIDALQLELESLVIEKSGDLAILQEKWKDTKAQIADLLALLCHRTKITEAAEQEAELRKAIDEKQVYLDALQADIQKASEEKAALTEKIATQEARLKELQDDKELREIEKERAELTGKVREIELAIKAVERNPRLAKIDGDITRLKEKIADLDLKDPACKSKSCSFIVGALAAQEQLPKVEDDRKAVEEEVRQAIALRRSQADKIADDLVRLQERQAVRVETLEAALLSTRRRTRRRRHSSGHHPGGRHGCPPNHRP